MPVPKSYFWRDGIYTLPRLVKLVKQVHPGSHVTFSATHLLAIYPSGSTYYYRFELDAPNAKVTIADKEGR